MATMTAAQTAQQSNRSNDGRYTTKSLGESGASIGSPSAPTPVGEHWIRIERQRGADLLVGPYLSEHEAEAALEESMLIDGFCEDDCLDAYLVHESDRAGSDEEVLIDRADPNHFGDVHLDLEGADA